MFEEDFYEALSKSLPGFGIFLFDHSHKFVKVIGDEILRLLGFAESDVIGRTPSDLGLHKCGENLEGYLQQALSGNILDMEMERLGRFLSIRIAPIKPRSGSISSGMMICHDITDTVRSRESLKSISLTDELTGIYNRRGFLLLAQQHLKLANRGCNGSLLFFMDVNDLKVVNDDMGHKVGDNVLKLTSRILLGSFRESDIIARYGGDEFVVLTTGVSRDMEYIFQMRLQGLINETNSMLDRFRISLSVGTSYYDPESPKTLDELITEADQRMYEHKRYRRNYGSGPIHISLR